MGFLYYLAVFKGGDFLVVLFRIPNDTLYRVKNALKMPKNDF